MGKPERRRQMNSRKLRGMITLWIIVALVAAVAIIAQKASAQTAIFTVFKKKVTLAAGGTLGFTVALNEPVNCKCTTNDGSVTSHGVGVVALTADNIAGPVGVVPRISYTSIDHNGNQHAGIFCSPVASAVDAFLKDAGANTCGGGTGLAAQTVVSPIGFVTPSGGPHLVQCGGSRDGGVFIETASSTNATVLRLHNHLSFAVPTRVTCDFMDLK